MNNCGPFAVGDVFTSTGVYIVNPPITAITSDDVHAFEWLHQHRAEQGESITTLGRRWLTRMIWHLEERIEADLRGKR